VQKAKATHITPFYSCIYYSTTTAFFQIGLAEPFCGARFALFAVHSRTASFSILGNVYHYT
jgi:hypothetical protein